MVGQHAVCEQAAARGRDVKGVACSHGTAFGVIQRAGSCWAEAEVTIRSFPECHAACHHKVASSGGCMQLRGTRSWEASVGWKLHVAAADQLTAELLGALQGQGQQLGAMQPSHEQAGTCGHEQAGISLQLLDSPLHEAWMHLQQATGAYNRVTMKSRHVHVNHTNQQYSSHMHGVKGSRRTCCCTAAS